MRGQCKIVLGLFKNVYLPSKFEIFGKCFEKNSDFEKKIQILEIFQKSDFEIFERKIFNFFGEKKIDFFVEKFSSDFEKSPNFFFLEKKTFFFSKKKVGENVLFLFLGDAAPDLGEQGIALSIFFSGIPRFGAEPRAVLGLVLCRNTVSDAVPERG